MIDLRLSNDDCNFIKYWFDKEPGVCRLFTGYTELSSLSNSDFEQVFYNLVMRLPYYLSSLNTFISDPFISSLSDALIKNADYLHSCLTNPNISTDKGGILK